MSVNLYWKLLIFCNNTYLSWILDHNLALVAHLKKWDSLITYISLHREAQTFNRRIGRKPHFWLYNLSGLSSVVTCMRHEKHFQLTLLPVLCRVLLAELEAHQDAWPFLAPVNHKAVPGYRKVIKKPMDFSTIREKLTNNQYVLVLQQQDRWIIFMHI